MHVVSEISAFIILCCRLVSSWAEPVDICELTIISFPCQMQGIHHCMRMIGQALRTFRGCIKSATCITSRNLVEARTTTQQMATTPSTQVPKHTTVYSQYRPHSKIFKVSKSCRWMSMLQSSYHGARIRREARGKSTSVFREKTLSFGWTWFQKLYEISIRYP